MKSARIIILVVGILLPYLARLPGMIVKGSGWLTSYFGNGIGAVLLIGALNAICWGTVLATTFSYRHPRSAWFPAAFGFTFTAALHSMVDLAADAQAAIALIFIPVCALPFILVGWLIGLWFDRRQA